jgi:ParB-like chromosome segregation protein Spo0J
LEVFLEIVEISVDEVFQDPNNVRLHDDKNIDAIKGSLKKFGQQKPIVIDENNIILAGNGTHQSAKALGWKTIACVKSTLKDFDKMAFALADNRTAELASWDMPKLQEQVALIDDPQLIGFDEDFVKFDDDQQETKTETIDGSKELDESNFDDFDHECPKCGFEWDDKK